MELRSEGWLICKNKEGKRGNIWKLDVRSHMTARHVTTGEKSSPHYYSDKNVYILIDIKEDTEFIVKTTISSIILLFFNIDSSDFPN